MNKRTKIVCTIGPACESVETLVKMVVAGMNVARLNFSHGSYENHTELFNNIREVEKQTGEPIAVLQDLQGPKIRVGVLPQEGIVLTAGTTVLFDTSLREYSGQAIPVDYKELHKYLKSGERLLLNDGKMETEIVSVQGTSIVTTVRVGGTLTSHKGINVPDSTLTVRAMSDKDKEDAKFGLSLGVDFIALSFVRNAQDVIELRTLLQEESLQKNIDTTTPIKIIAKIERKEAVENIESILEVVDGIMVARGDLGIEVPGEQVPVIQKRLIEAALRFSKPVIVATQMLDSMQENPRPTRAEVSDVANAVIDHTDAVMLSNESAVGKYPVETVETMGKVLVETEASNYNDLPLELHSHKGESASQTLEDLGRILAQKVQAQAIVVGSNHEDAARVMSSFRPELPIFVPAHNTRVLHQMNLQWGVVPILSEAVSLEKFLQEIKQKYTDLSQVVVVGSESFDSPELSVLEIVHLA